MDGCREEAPPSGADSGGPCLDGLVPWGTSSWALADSYAQRHRSLPGHPQQPQHLVATNPSVLFTLCKYSTTWCLLWAVQALFF